MKNFLFLVPLFAACKIERQSNLAEIMVKAQAPQASCKGAKAGDDVAICTVPGKDKAVEVVAVYSKDNGFKVFPLSPLDEKPTPPAQPAAPTPPAPGAGSGANAPAAGSGSGSAK